MESRAHLERWQEAPDFHLVDTHGGEIPLVSLQGSKATVIIFMCNHCPFVLFKLKRMIELAQKYSSKGVSFVGINSNDAQEVPEDSFEHMQGFAQEHKLPFPYLYDESQEVAELYGATCTPDPFVFDRHLKLAYHGRFDNALSPGEKTTDLIFERVLDALIAGTTSEPWFLPSMGCSIKWRE